MSGISLDLKTPSVTATPLNTVAVSGLTEEERAKLERQSGDTKILPLSNDQQALNREHATHHIVEVQGASTLQLTKKESAALIAPIRDEDVDIREDGIPYLSQVFFRERLNAVLGVGQWAVVQHDFFKSKTDDRVFFDGSLFIRGHFVGRGIGEAVYYEQTKSGDLNRNQSWASVFEAAKSDCITRVCKDLSIGKELWQKRFIERWRRKYAVRVYRTEKNRHAWRHIDADPFHDEQKKQTVTAGGTTATLAEFDCTKETIGFGKYKGMRWIECDNGYLTYLIKNGQQPDIRARAEATKKHKESIEQQVEANPSPIDRAIDRKETEASLGLASLDAVFDKEQLFQKLGAELEQIAAAGDLNRLRLWYRLRTRHFGLAEGQRTLLYKSYDAAIALIERGKKI